MNATWLQRVEDVVDAALERGLHTIVNAHHESWFDLPNANGNYTAIEQQFYQLWYQIGTQLGCKSSLLAFEPINEPSANTADQIAELNKIEALFIQALADSGGELDALQMIDSTTNRAHRCAAGEKATVLSVKRRFAF